MLGISFFEFLPFSFPSPSPLLAYISLFVCLFISLLLLFFSISSNTLNQGSCFYRIRCVCPKAVIYGSGACEDPLEGSGGIAGLKQRRMARSVITRETERRRLL